MPPKRKLFKISKNIGRELRVFVDYPEVPMDNNKAERHERTPVIARNNFYGSFALWAGTLAAATTYTQPDVYMPINTRVSKNALLGLDFFSGFGTT